MIDDKPLTDEERAAWTWLRLQLETEHRREQRLAEIDRRGGLIRSFLEAIGTGVVGIGIIFVAAAVTQLVHH